MSSQQERAARFRALHEGEPFLIPNPWDGGSARVFEALGFQALATTSSGFAFTLGRLDSNVTLDEACDHIALLVSVTELPISADLENGFGPRPEDAAEAISRAAAAGAVGGSIEDWDPTDGLYDATHATERISAAVGAARALDFPFTLTARAENHIRDNDDLDDTIERLVTYEDAGADVLYAPGLGSTEQVAAVCSALSRPVNVLARPNLPIEDVFAAGAQRVSVGGSLAFVALKAAVDAAISLRDRGDAAGLRAQLPLEEWLS